VTYHYVPLECVTVTKGSLPTIDRHQGELVASAFYSIRVTTAFLLVKIWRAATLHLEHGKHAAILPGWRTSSAKRSWCASTLYAYAAKCCGVLPDSIGRPWGYIVQQRNNGWAL